MFQNRSHLVVLKECARNYLFIFLFQNEVSAIVFKTIGIQKHLILRRPLPPPQIFSLEFVSKELATLKNHVPKINIRKQIVWCRILALSNHQNTIENAIPCY